MSKNTASSLDIISKLLVMGEDENSNARWITQNVDNYLESKDVESIEDLDEDSRWSLVEKLKESFIKNDHELPDYLVQKTDLAVGEEPIHVKNESDLKEQLRKSNLKLQVASEFLKDLDSQVAKYESTDMDAVTDLLNQYESIGTPEELMEYIALTRGKLESGENCDSDDSDDYEDEELESDESDEDEDDEEDSNESDTKTKTEGEDMSDENPQTNEESSEMEDMKKLLARYQELGTPEEIEELIDRSSDMIDDNSELTEKTESMNFDLSKYESIGTPDEILSVVHEYAEIKEKAESIRISEDLGIPVEKVLSTIEKMESVHAAETLLTELFVKTEAEKEEMNSYRQKNESVDESAELVNDNGNPSVSSKFNKGKLESNRKTTLQQICAKL